MKKEVEIVVDPVKEARRYVMNAKDALIAGGKYNIRTNHYEDRKYVRIAGNTLWNGVLLILDAVFHVKTKQQPHPDVGDYRDVIANRDKKLLSLFVAGYEVMHIAMGYDGIQSKVICQEGIRIASSIIDRCAAMLP